jgi:hypothetical protein
MLTSKLLGRKRIIEKLGKQFTDLISSTFKIPETAIGTGGMLAVNDFENMRPDLVAERIYGNQSKWDALLKTNGISNPFALKSGDLLMGMPDSSLNACYVNPLSIPEREQREANPNNPVVNPKTQKDKNRLDNLKKKSKAGTVLPPNINPTGINNTESRDGRIIFGNNNTDPGVRASAPSISRQKLRESLLKDNISI